MTDQRKYTTLADIGCSGWICNNCSGSLDGETRIEHVCGTEGIVLFDKPAANENKSSDYDGLLKDYREAVLQIILLRTQMKQSEWQQCAKEANSAMDTMRLGGDTEDA